MDSRYLSSLIAVIEQGSIADAARRQGITAAAVSQRIQVLERELNTTLLSRVGHTAKPTEAAIAILTRARRIVREVDLLAADIDENGLSGQIRIGAISTVLTGILPPALLNLHRLAPDVVPVIVPGTSTSLYEALMKEEIDVAIIVQPPFDVAKRYKTIPLLSEELILLSDQPLAHSVFETLNTLPYISYDQHSWGGRIAQKFIDDNKLQPHLLLELDAIETISLLVKEGMGVSLLPKWDGLHSLVPDLTQTPAGEGYEREIVLLTRPLNVKEQLMKLLINVLHSKTPDL